MRNLNKNNKNGLCKATKSVYSSFILSEEVRACFSQGSLSFRAKSREGAAE